jgi:hypothetical protein
MELLVTQIFIVEIRKIMNCSDNFIEPGLQALHGVIMIQLVSTSINLETQIFIIEIRKIMNCFIE